ncbi:MAG: hypothetical protein IKS31_04500 [Clostridia bacterium]|nr:hypothetical protein [Clostridia bacterium]MBR4458203.1 hypothetical protein [Clostridia bacterium]
MYGSRERREMDWADRRETADEAAEPTYRDGSVQNECWAETGYTRSAGKEDEETDGGRD